MKRIFGFLFCLIFPIPLFAQASGGQITRPTKSMHVEKKKKEVNNKQTATQQEVQTEHTYEAPPPPPNIQPVSINDLGNNIAVGTTLYGNISVYKYVSLYLKQR